MPFRESDALDLLAVLGIGVVALVVSVGTIAPAFVPTARPLETPDLAVSSLSAEQRALVGTAMEASISAPPIRTPSR